MSIVKRGVTIAIGAPIAVGLTLHPVSITFLVWLSAFLSMVEWTAVKRHLKVVLLSALARETDAGRQTPPPPEQLRLSMMPGEYSRPVARTNTFILVKCFLSTLPVPCCCMAYPEYFHVACSCYFFFWVLMTLSFQNKLEFTAYQAQQKVEKSGLSVAQLAAADEHRKHTQQFAIRELAMIASQPLTDNFLSFALEYFGFVWVLGLAHALLMYHHIPRYGSVCTVAVLVCNWANDFVALIVGRSLKGRTTPLYPRISPNKSREGAIAGIIANGVSAALLAAFWPAVYTLDWGYFSGWFTWLIVGFACGVLGVIGDLLQSLLKRAARVKDTGALLPGHGGILDRVDGLMLTVPFVHWLLWWFVTTHI
jgi:CDP-diglyceride synthetase